MYARQDPHRGRSISIPHNYSGNAFSDQDNGDAPLIDLSIHEQEKPIPISDERNLSNEKQKSFLPINIGTEELLLIGMIILLFQSGAEDSLTPLLLILLLFGGYQ